MVKLGKLRKGNREKVPGYEHSWDVTEDEARTIQSRLSKEVQKTNGFEPGQIKSIAGIDVSLKDEGQAAVVVLSFPELEVLDRAVATRKLTFPYIPGLLSFRETPLVLDAIARLKVQPDMLMVDGQGYAHPRRFGIACHLGVFLDKPSIGCAKSVLTGKFEEVGPNPGDQSPIVAKRYGKEEVIGVALRSKLRSNPLIISIGHKIDLPTAVDFVQKCLRGYRLPEPTRAAHNFAGSADAFPVPGRQINPPDEDGMVQARLF